MIYRKQFTLLALLIFIVAVTIAAIKPPQQKERNLQVLPKDISDERLDSIMQSYSKALGIGCSFCHSAHKSIPDSLDYASDEHGMKEEARKMMRLTIGINREYFYFDKNQRPEYLNIVTCQTCHRGEPVPSH